MVPELHHAVSVQQEDTVANRLENARRLLALGRSRTRCGLRGFETPPLALESGVPNRRRHLGDERLEQLHLLAGVLAVVAHELHDSHDRAVAVQVVGV